MATIPEIEANILKMQQLLKAAQNEIQKKTFQDIINNLSQQLEREKSKLHPPKAENLKLEKLPEKEITKQLVQQEQAETEKHQKLRPKSESQIEAQSEVEVEEKLEDHEDESLLPKQDYVFQGLNNINESSFLRVLNYFGVFLYLLEVSYCKH